MRQLLTKFAASYWGAVLALGVGVSVWLIFGLPWVLAAIGWWILTGVAFVLAQLVVEALVQASGLTGRGFRSRNAGVPDSRRSQVLQTRQTRSMRSVTRLRMGLSLLTLCAIAVAFANPSGRPVLLAVAAGLVMVFGAMTGAFVHLIDGVMRSLMNRGDDPPGHPPSDGSPVPTGGGPRAPKPLVARAKPRPA
ncbi:MAG: hypothetical protein HYR85_21315 [Planctomycetes bacterium]|nr:hypothetical protein [Planctomycetota bacterium]MBI3847101.1 hypothetical protein [Planctomycetota bacterium]